MAFPLESLFEIGTKIIDRIIPDKEKQAEAKLKLLELQQNGDLAVMAQQTEINKIEAASSDKFTSRWRPAVAWCCVAGFAMQYVIGPTLTWLSIVIGHPIPYPQLDTGVLSTLLVGLLGLGTLRTVEKLNNAQGNH